MSTYLTVLEGKLIENYVTFTYESQLPLLTLIPAGKMITDSEKMSFVYLVDEEDEYGHIYFPQSVWEAMILSLKSEKDPYIEVHNKKITLKNFNEELMMLIFNIEGNYNYGEAFSVAVEKSFHDILAE